MSIYLQGTSGSLLLLRSLSSGIFPPTGTPREIELATKEGSKNSEIESTAGAKYGLFGLGKTTWAVSMSQTKFRRLSERN
jgi:hypothetical protein